MTTFIHDRDLPSVANKDTPTVTSAHGTPQDRHGEAQDTMTTTNEAFLHAQNSISASTHPHTKWITSLELRQQALRPPRPFTPSPFRYMSSSQPVVYTFSQNNTQSHGSIRPVTRHLTHSFQQELIQLQTRAGQEPTPAMLAQIRLIHDTPNTQRGNTIVEYANIFITLQTFDRLRPQTRGTEAYLNNDITDMYITH